MRREADKARKEEESRVCNLGKQRGESGREAKSEWGWIEAASLGLAEETESPPTHTHSARPSLGINPSKLDGLQGENNTPVDCGCSCMHCVLLMIERSPN